MSENTPQRPVGDESRLGVVPGLRHYDDGAATYRTHVTPNGIPYEIQSNRDSKGRDHMVVYAGNHPDADYDYHAGFHSKDGWDVRKVRAWIDSNEPAFEEKIPDDEHYYQPTSRKKKP